MDSLIVQQNSSEEEQKETFQPTTYFIFSGNTSYGSAVTINNDFKKVFHFFKPVIKNFHRL